MKTAWSVDVIIPVYQPGKEFLQLLQRLDQQTKKPDRVFLVNTEKSCWDLFAEKAGDRLSPLLSDITLWHITKGEFDHAGTRNEAAERSMSDLLLFMTMDALPADKMLIENLVAAFEDKKVAVAYARQLPKKGATQLEKMTRAFNYPEEGTTKSEADLERLGIKTYFCSDVCAMYRRDIFESLGGFSEPAVFNEDMIYVAAAMKAGYKVSYSADAKVLHSHNYGGRAQFHRNFDIGASQVMHPEVFGALSSEKEGVKMLKGQAKQLFVTGHGLEIISLFYLSACKYLGYFLGKRYAKLPRGLVLRCTSNRVFWNRMFERQ
ncbi:MAG: glycosyltransferase [Lachnospiraceae bacterium]|nr:glycosyltransferase [Lachnospiraceae bacterium]